MDELDYAGRGGGNTIFRSGTQLLVAAPVRSSSNASQLYEWSFPQQKRTRVCSFVQLAAPRALEYSARGRSSATVRCLTSESERRAGGTMRASDTRVWRELKLGLERGSSGT